MARELANLPSKAMRDEKVAELERMVEKFKEWNQDATSLVRDLADARRVAAIIVPTAPAPAVAPDPAPAPARVSDDSRSRRRGAHQGVDSMPLTAGSTLSLTRLCAHVSTFTPAAAAIPTVMGVASAATAPPSAALDADQIADAIRAAVSTVLEGKSC